MATNLFTPILNGRTRSVNFFNGRLLTGEDLTAEQKANRVAHSLLGQAAGSGVAYGFEVSESALLSTAQAPVLSIARGLAINPNGGTLLLDSDTDIALVRPAASTNGSASAFQECTSIQSGVYIAGAGVYLLTVGPASASQGLAEVNGINPGAAPCNSKYKADGVQFRLLQIDLTQAELGDVNHLRNLLAYKCFGVTDWAADITDPFGTHPAGHGLIDQLRFSQTITGCEVPLAMLYWTATGGLVFVDMWAVRRPVVSRELLDSWAPGAGRKRTIEGLAMFLQFQDQIAGMLGTLAPATLLSVKATDYFSYLPAVGLVPIGNIRGSTGFDYLQFFSGMTYHDPVFIEGAKFDELVLRSMQYPAKDLTNAEMVWLYRVRENMESVAQSTANPPQPFMIFTNGQMPYEGKARFDLNYWDYANYS
jgi:hypothetical protein